MFDIFSNFDVTDGLKRQRKSRYHFVDAFSTMELRQ
jgi:hypothetical protein